MLGIDNDETVLERETSTEIELTTKSDKGDFHSYNCVNGNNIILYNLKKVCALLFPFSLLHRI